jgi:hypothetical protein
VLVLGVMISPVVHDATNAANIVVAIMIPLAFAAIMWVRAYRKKGRCIPDSPTGLYRDNDDCESVWSSLCCINVMTTRSSGGVSTVGGGSGAAALQQYTYDNLSIVGGADSRHSSVDENSSQDRRHQEQERGQQPQQLQEQTLQEPPRQQRQQDGGGIELGLIDDSILGEERAPSNDVPATDGRPEAEEEGGGGSDSSSSDHGDNTGGCRRVLCEKTSVGTMLYAMRWTLLGLGTSASGLLCFAFQNRTNYWLVHSLWHCFVMLSTLPLLIGRFDFMHYMHRKTGIAVVACRRRLRPAAGAGAGAAGAGVCDATGSTTGGGGACI